MNYIPLEETVRRDTAVLETPQVCNVSDNGFQICLLLSRKLPMGVCSGNALCCQVLTQESQRPDSLKPLLALICFLICVIMNVLLLVDALGLPTSLASGEMESNQKPTLPAKATLGQLGLSLFPPLGRLYASY